MKWKYTMANPRVIRAYVVTDARGAQVTYQAYNPADAKRIAEGEGMIVVGVFRE